MKHGSETNYPALYLLLAPPFHHDIYDQYNWVVQAAVSVAGHLCQRHDTRVERIGLQNHR